MLIEKKVIRIGNSLGITIPKEFIKENNVKIGDFLTILIKNHKKSVKNHKKLVKKCTKDL